jgi:16S rRNA (uracil1498-N3)-methyltransferase
MNVFIAKVNGQTAELTEEESWHCAKVLRKKPGEPVNLIDGNGNFFEAALDLVSDKKCTAKITRGPTLQDPSKYFLHLAIAPTKQLDRIEWMVEKAVEIGVHEISFFTSQNSERTTLKNERMVKIVESAVKQSLQARIPAVNEIVSLKDILKRAKEDQKFIAHCADKPKKQIRSLHFENKTTLMLIGPEGDFTAEEVALAEKEGFEGISLGKNRLRSETAGLYACQAISILTMDF